MATPAPSCLVRRISPMLAVADMDATLRFYTMVLGFSITMQSPEYSIVERNGASIHFMKAADESVMEAVRGHAEIYLEVSDIHAIWPHVAQFKGQYKIQDIFDRDYGLTEFHIADPNDCLVFVGQPTSELHPT